MKTRRLGFLALVALAALSTPAAAAGADPTAADYTRLADELEAYLSKHVLDPRFPRCVDKERGGFHAHYARDWSPRPDLDRFIVYQARIVWTAAEIARAHPKRREEYLGYLRPGLRYLADVMWDKEHGGFFTSVKFEGQAAVGGSAPSP